MNHLLSSACAAPSQRAGSEKRNSGGAGSFSKEQIEGELAKRAQCWHSPIDLGHGIITKGRSTQKRFERRLRLLGIPEDLRGKQVLDIGTWDGFFTWEMEKRGGQVMAIDQWDDVSFEQFEWVRRVKGSAVRYQRMDVFDITPENTGVFDLILFAGVLYHLRYPLATLEKIRKCCRGQLILETVCMIPAFHNNFPMMAFFPGDEEALKTPRFWDISGAATIPWVKEALLAAGFKRVEVVYRPSFRRWKQFVALLRGSPQGGRCILHAFV
jgi:tRNA (mo5U34)-methyltransferase